MTLYLYENHLSQGSDCHSPLIKVDSLNSKVLHVSVLFNDYLGPGGLYYLIFLKKLRKMILLLMLYFTSYFLWYRLIMVVQEDPVLLVPEDERQKPYVAIIKVTDLLI